MEKTIEELSKELRFELKRIKKFKDAFAEIKRYSGTKKGWFKGNTIVQIDRGLIVADNLVNKKKCLLLIEYLRQKIKFLKNEIKEV